MSKKLLQALTSLLALCFLLMIVFTIIFFDNRLPENFKIAIFPICLFCAFFGWFVSAQKEFVKEKQEVKKDIIENHEIESTNDWDMK